MDKSPGKGKVLSIMGRLRARSLRPGDRESLRNVADEELWLYANTTAHGMVARGLREAASGLFADREPSPETDRRFADQLIGG